LARAVERLIGQPEHSAAAEVLADLPLCAVTLDARCNELPRLLETTRDSTALLAWSI
jgi:hypothetical protein